MNMFARIALVVLLVYGTQIDVNAQGKNKLGHIDTQALLLQMPERADAEKTLQDYAKQLETKLSTMSAEYQSKVLDYQQKLAAGQMEGLIKETTEKELIELENQIQKFRATANESLAGKESELLTPMVEKINKAIKEVAKEGNFTYIFDKGQGSSVLYAPDSDDISSLVKKKLGIIQ